MELKPGDIIQILNKGDDCVLLLVLESERFNADNKKPITAWNSLLKREEKVWVDALWHPSAIEGCLDSGKVKPYLPEIRYIGEWVNYREDTQVAMIAILDLRKRAND